MSYDAGLDPRLSGEKRYCPFLVQPYVYVCALVHIHLSLIAVLVTDILMQTAQNVPIAKKLESQRTGFMAAMSDSGLKPTVVYHNLTPAELYEKVQTLLPLLQKFNLVLYPPLRVLQVSSHACLSAGLAT